VSVDELGLLFELLHVDVGGPDDAREEPDKGPVELDEPAVHDSVVFGQEGEKVEHGHGSHDHGDCREDIGVVEAGDKSQHEDQSSRLQGLTTRRVDGVAEYDDDRVAQQRLREVEIEPGKQLIHHKTESAQPEVVEDTHVRKADAQEQGEPEEAEYQSGGDKDNELPPHVDDLSLVLVVLVLGLLVQVVQLKVPLVDGAGGDLPPSVVVQLGVDVFEDLLEAVGFGYLHHVGVDQRERPLDVRGIDLLIERLELVDAEGLVDVLIFFIS